MKIQSNNPYYKGKSVRFKNETVKFDNKGVAEVSAEMAEYLTKEHKGFFEEGKAEPFKTQKEQDIEKFTGDVQKKYLEEISKLKAEKEFLLKKIEKLEVSEKAWRENYIKLEKKIKDGAVSLEGEATETKKEGTAIEADKKKEESSEKAEEELIARLEQLSKDELRAFAIENGISETEIGQKREKGIIELILNKLSK